MHAYIQCAKTYTANTYMHRYIQKYKKKTTKKSILAEYVRQKSQKTLSELIAFIPTGGSNLHKHAGKLVCSASRLLPLYGGPGIMSTVNIYMPAPNAVGRLIKFFSYRHFQ